MLEFFRHLSGTLEPDLETRKDFARLGSRMLKSLAPLAGASVNLFVPGTGKLVSSSMDIVGDLMRREETVEKLYDKISKTLRHDENKRYLIIIDDIDRLAPDEVLLILRLIKSVARLPKIIYLLAYDRKIVEKIVSEHYPSEGPHYLEKIVQAEWDIPYPLPDKLTEFFAARITKLLWEEKTDEKLNLNYSHFKNVLEKVIVPQIKSPRDINRVMNALNLTWPAVVDYVDPADFFALETFRVKQPRLYAILKTNRDRLTGVISIDENNNNRKRNYEDIFLSEFQGDEREEMKEALCLLFPPLETVWKDKNYHGMRTEWDRRRRACSDKHFHTYFRFSVSPEMIGKSEIDAIIKNSGDEKRIESMFLETANMNADNEKRVRLEKLLDELKIHIKKIPVKNAKAFLSALFTVHDKIYQKVSESYDLTVISYELLINLPLYRNIDNKSEIICYVIKNRSLPLITLLAIEEYKKYHLQENELSQQGNDFLMTESDMKDLCKTVLTKIEDAKRSNNLLENKQLKLFLFAWHLLLNDSELSNSEERQNAKLWSMEQLSEDLAVERFAKALVTVSRGLDLDGKRVEDYFFSGNMLESFFDFEILKQRVKELHDKSEPESERHMILSRFLKACSNPRLPNIKSFDQVLIPGPPAGAAPHGKLP